MSLRNIISTSLSICRVGSRIIGQTLKRDAYALFRVKAPTPNISCTSLVVRKPGVAQLCKDWWEQTVQRGVKVRLSLQSKVKLAQELAPKVRLSVTTGISVARSHAKVGAKWAGHTVRAHAMPVYFTGLAVKTILRKSWFAVRLLFSLALWGAWMTAISWFLGPNKQPKPLVAKCLGWLTWLWHWIRGLIGLSGRPGRLSRIRMRYPSVWNVLETVGLVVVLEWVC